MIFAERVKIGTRDIKVELKKHHGNSQENQKMDHPTQVSGGQADHRKLWRLGQKGSSYTEVLVRAVCDDRTTKTKKIQGERII